MKTLSLACLILFATPTLFAAQKLFQSGQEVFLFKTQNEKTPEFRLFDDSPLKRSFAVMANSVLGLSKPTPYIDLKLERLYLEPMKNNPAVLRMKLKLSGKDYELEPRLKRADLENGKLIEMQFAPKDHELSGFGVKTAGHFKMRYNAVQNTLDIEKIHANMLLKNPWLGNETEQLDFVGKATRLTK